MELMSAYEVREWQHQNNQYQLEEIMVEIKRAMRNNQTSLYVREELNEVTLSKLKVMQYKILTRSKFLQFFVGNQQVIKW